MCCTVGLGLGSAIVLRLLGVATSVQVLRLLGVTVSVQMQDPVPEPTVQCEVQVTRHNDLDYGATIVCTP